MVQGAGLFVGKEANRVTADSEILGLRVLILQVRLNVKQHLINSLFL